jgi:hypothetical protein
LAWYGWPDLDTIERSLGLVGFGKYGVGQPSRWSKRPQVFLAQAIKHNRLARWAAIAIALNTLQLIGPICDQLGSAKTVKLLIPAADVTPMHDAGTGELDSYYVESIPVDEVAIWARWPTFGTLYGVIGINIALFAWMLRLAILEHRFIIGDVEIREVRAPFRNRGQEQERPTTDERQRPPSVDKPGG